MSVCQDATTHSPPQRVPTARTSLVHLAMAAPDSVSRYACSSLAVRLLYRKPLPTAFIGSAVKTSLMTLYQCRLSMARAVPSHHGRFRADARSYLPAIVIVTVHSSLLLPAPCVGRLWRSSQCP